LSFTIFWRGTPPPPSVSRGQGTAENDRRRPWNRGFGNPTSTVERRDALIHISRLYPYREWLQEMPRWAVAIQFSEDFMWGKGIEEAECLSRGLKGIFRRFRG